MVNHIYHRAIHGHTHSALSVDTHVPATPHIGCRCGLSGLGIEPGTFHTPGEGAPRRQGCSAQWLLSSCPWYVIFSQVPDLELLGCTLWSYGRDTVKNGWISRCVDHTSTNALDEQGDRKWEDDATEDAQDEEEGSHHASCALVLYCYLSVMEKTTKQRLSLAKPSSLSCSWSQILLITFCAVITDTITNLGGGVRRLDALNWASTSLVLKCSKAM